MSTWKKFKQKFGTSTTTMSELISYAHHLKLKPFRCVMRDQVKDLPQYGYFIINIQTNKANGAHWSAVYSDPNKVYFFDSYALPPNVMYPEIAKKFNHTTNRICGDKDEQIQTYGKEYCGQMALYFLYRISKGSSYKDILQDIKRTENVVT